MNWEAFGAVGEVVGAMAVVATLLYLAKQTKTSSDSIQVQSGRGVSFHLSNWYQGMAGNPELMRVFNKSTQVPLAEFDEDEWNQFNFLAKSFLHAIEAQYVSRALGLGFADQDDGYLRAARTLIATYPAWTRFWEEERTTGFYPPGLVEILGHDDLGVLRGMRFSKGAGRSEGP